MLHRLKPTPFILSLLLLSAPALAELKIENAWIKNLPPTVPMRAGYMTITNTGAKVVTILAIDCEACSSIELHESVMHDGMMSMQHLPRLKIGPSERVSLAPGGKHLMLQPLQPTKIGEQVSIRFHFEDGSSQPAVLTVRE